MTTIAARLMTKYRIVLIRKSEKFNSSSNVEKSTLWCLIYFHSNTASYVCKDISGWRSRQIRLLKNISLSHANWFIADTQLIAQLLFKISLITPTLGFKQMQVHQVCYQTAKNCELKDSTSFSIICYIVNDGRRWWNSQHQH